MLTYNIGGRGHIKTEFEVQIKRKCYKIKFYATNDYFFFSKIKGLGVEKAVTSPLLNQTILVKRYMS